MQDNCRLSNHLNQKAICVNVHLCLVKYWCVCVCSQCIAIICHEWFSELLSWEQKLWQKQRNASKSKLIEIWLICHLFRIYIYICVYVCIYLANKVLFIALQSDLNCFCLARWFFLEILLLLLCSQNPYLIIRELNFANKFSNV